MKKLSVENAKSINEYLLKFDAMIYLKKSKFNKMTPAQKEKAILLLSDFQIHLNTD